MCVTRRTYLVKSSEHDGIKFDFVSALFCVGRKQVSDAFAVVLLNYVFIKWFTG